MACPAFRTASSRSVRHGRWKLIANLNAFQTEHPVAHPDPEDFEPAGTWYSMVAAGRALYPMDSNHGELDRVTRHGRISRVIDISACRDTSCPPRSSATRPFYIANLGLFDPGDLPGDEHLYRLTRQRTLRVRATGWRRCSGSPSARGPLYALEMSTTAGRPTPGTGRDRAGHGRTARVPVVSGLTFPTGMAVGPDGAFYVSDQGFGFGAGEGQILRIQL